MPRTATSVVQHGLRVVHVQIPQHHLQNLPHQLRRSLAHDVADELQLRWREHPMSGMADFSSLTRCATKVPQRSGDAFELRQEIQALRRVGRTQLGASALLRVPKSRSSSAWSSVYSCVRHVGLFIRAPRRRGQSSPAAPAKSLRLPPWSAPGIRRIASAPATGFETPNPSPGNHRPSLPGEHLEGSANGHPRRGREQRGRELGMLDAADRKTLGERETTKAKQKNR